MSLRASKRTSARAYAKLGRRAEAGAATAAAERERKQGSDAACVVSLFWQVREALGEYLNISPVPSRSSSLG